MNQQDYTSELDLLKTVIYDETINQYTIKEKADIYKAKLMMEFMKKIRFDEIATQIDYLLQQHQTQLSLSGQLSHTLFGYDGVVAVPVYAKEKNIDKLIDVISRQNGKFCTVLYFNAPKDSISQDEFHQTIGGIQNIIANKDNFFLIHHLYDAKATMGQIRDHLLTTLYLAASTSKDTVVIGLDADTYHLGNGYIQQSIEHAKNPKYAFIKGQLRRMDHAHGLEHPYVYLEDIIEMLFSKYFTNSASIASSGGGTSFLLDEAFNVGGYNTSLNMGEDVYLGRSLRANNPRKIARSIPNKVFTSPRRALHVINQGDGILDQWNMDSEDFAPIDEFDSNDTSDLLKRMDTIIQKMLDNHRVGHDELWEINERIEQIIEKLGMVYRNSYNQHQTEYLKMKKVFKSLLRWLRFALRKTSYEASFIHNTKGKIQGVFITHPDFIEKELLVTN